MSPNNRSSDIILNPAQILTRVSFDIVTVYIEIDFDGEKNALLQSSYKDSIREAHIEYS